MNRNLIPVKGHPDLARDMNTNAIVNINKEQADRRRAARDALIKEKQEFEQVKSDVKEIKALLHKLLENGSNG